MFQQVPYAFICEFKNGVSLMGKRWLIRLVIPTSLAAVEKVEIWKCQQKSSYEDGDWRKADELHVEELVVSLPCCKGILRPLALRMSFLPATYPIKLLKDGHQPDFTQ